MTHYSVTVFIYSVTVFIIAFSHCPSRPNADSRGLSNCTLSIVKLSSGFTSLSTLSATFAPCRLYAQLLQQRHADGPQQQVFPSFRRQLLRQSLHRQSPLLSRHLFHRAIYRLQR